MTNRNRDNGNLVETKKWYTLQELLEMKIEKVPMLWDPFLQEVGVAGIAGTSDCGKSSFVRALCLAIALGKTEFLNHPLNPRYRKVYYIATEDTVHGIAEALNTICSHDAEIQNAVGIEFLFTTVDVMSIVEKALKNEPADLIVVDAWADLFMGNANVMNDVRQDLRQYREIAQKYGCLFLLIHHLVKNYKGAPDKGKINGSQAIEAVTRSFLELRNGASYKEKELSILKGNYASGKLKEQSLVLHFDEESRSFTNKGDIRIFSDYVRANATKYKGELWYERFKSIQDETGLSIEKCRELLKRRFKGEDVPSKTWFINKGKEAREQDFDDDENDFDEILL